MTSYARRLAALDDALPLAPPLEAMLCRLAVVVGVPADVLRADAHAIARRYAGLTMDETIEHLAAETGIAAEPLRADVAELMAIAEGTP